MNQPGEKGLIKKVKLCLGKILLTMIVIAILGIPTWIILAVKYLLDAQGFWQNLIVYGARVYLLGTFQLVLAVLGLLIISQVWRPSSKKGGVHV